MCLNTPKVLGKALSAPSFIRTVKYGSDHLALQTACHVLQKAAYPTIQLIATIHVGEFNYYKKLQKITSQADLVLHEGIDNQDRRSYNPNNSIYRGIAKKSKLVTQCSVMSYKNNNYRCCDLSMKVLNQLLYSESPDNQNSAEEKFYSIQQKWFDDAKNSDALLQFNRRTVKSVAFQRLQLIAMGLDPHNNVINTNLNHVVLDHRNKHVISNIKQILENEKHQKIAVLYGAAHMPGIANWLLKHGYKFKQETMWYDAIHCNPISSGLSDDEISDQFKRAK